MKYLVKLNDNVTDEMLKEKGFIIDETRNTIWAVKEGEDRTTDSQNNTRGSIIIKLQPPERLIMFRYQADDYELDLIEKIKFMKGMYKVIRWKKST